MSGYEVCAALKAEPRTAAIPVIFVSALSETDDELEGFNAGAVDYISQAGQPADRARTRAYPPVAGAHGRAARDAPGKSSSAWAWRPNTRTTKPACP